VHFKGAINKPATLNLQVSHCCFYHPLLLSLAINYASIAITIDPTLWEAHKEQIENLYYTCNLELEHVIYVISVYGFIVGPTSYKAQLKKWNDARDIPLSKSL
jgi:Clr5 domain